MVRLAKVLQPRAEYITASVKRSLEELALQGDEAAVVDPVSWQLGKLGKLAFEQQSLVKQRLRRNQERIAGKGRRTRVRRVAETRRPEWQHLPQRLPRLGQKAEELRGSRTKIANAEAARQRGRMKQHARAAPIEQHQLARRLSLSLWEWMKPREARVRATFVLGASPHSLLSQRKRE